MQLIFGILSYCFILHSKEKYVVECVLCQGKLRQFFQSIYRMWKNPFFPILLNITIPVLLFTFIFCKNKIFGILKIRQGIAK